MRKSFVITIETDDDNIREKYPNYRFNWNSPGQFIHYLANDMTDDVWDDFGYRITVSPYRNTLPAK